MVRGSLAYERANEMGATAQDERTSEAEAYFAAKLESFFAPQFLATEARCATLEVRESVRRELARLEAWEKNGQHGLQRSEFDILQLESEKRRFRGPINNFDLVDEEK